MGGFFTRGCGVALPRLPPWLPYPTLTLTLLPRFTTGPFTLRPAPPQAPHLWPLDPVHKALWLQEVVAALEAVGLGRGGRRPATAQPQLAVA